MEGNFNWSHLGLDPWRPKDFSAKRTEREKNYYAKEKEKTKCERRYTEWPDAELKNSPNFSKRCPKSNHSSLTRKVLFLPLAQKYTMHLGYFWQKPCHQELSKMPNVVTLKEKEKRSFCHFFAYAEKRIQVRRFLLCIKKCFSQTKKH